tara:strand:+ start:113 stop:532 length:420 start_codon:yes stop_codon:yes gene_type:complete
MGKQMSVKERLFARYVAEGRTQAESVRMAGFASSNPDKKGSELVKKQQVVDLINQRGSELTDERAVSLREHLDTLAALRDDARKAGQYSSAIQAEHHRGKASRLYVEQQAIVNADADSPSVILERLNGLLSRDRVVGKD